jgi:hypothetical protein
VQHQPPSEVSLLLQGWRNGDRKALDALLPLVYKELRRLARFQLRKETASPRGTSRRLHRSGDVRFSFCLPLPLPNANCIEIEEITKCMAGTLNTRAQL